MCSSVRLFAAGHAAELYLKAAHTFLFGSIDTAIGLGHDVKKIWDACKKEDDTFLAGHEIRDSILDVDFLDPAVRSGLTESEQRHLSEHQALYVIAKRDYLPNLKYFGLPWKPRRDGGTVIVWRYPDESLISFFGDLRRYLGHPLKGRADIIGDMLEYNEVPPPAACFLQKLSQG